MRIAVIALCLLAAMTGVWSDSVQNTNSDSSSAFSGKRETTDQNASGKANGQNYRQTQSQQMQPFSGYTTLGSFAAGTSPQVVYAKPAGGIQYAPSGYKGPIIAPAQILIPQYALAPHSPDIKAAAPFHLTYAQPAPIQYALAIAPEAAEIKHQGIAVAAPAALPFQGPQIHLAFAPITQSVGHIVKGGGFAYAAQVPQMALLAAPQVAAPQPVHPYAAYSIQPSIQIAAGKQVITPTVATPPYKQLSPPPATSYATFSQQLPVTATPVTPAKVPQVISQPLYATPATPVYSGGKVAYRSIDQAVQDAGAIYSHPGAIHYGTHLYHPSFAKISPFIGAHKYF